LEKPDDEITKTVGLTFPSEHQENNEEGRVAISLAISQRMKNLSRF
jgi:hypothetical protein